ncbi:3-oxo-tetronate kinase [Geminicoccaceae bacterium 1502E]|nr:3-oxo-tetronate kinase [Geminicoccaceae bacterium 1502E]
MSLLLGCIADDFTGATDLCNTLVRRGMRTIQLIDAPPADLPVPEADAITIALKSRTCPPEEAVRLSLQSLEWLRRAGARQFLFKYCSTFDSTEKGNIGPVADALLDALGSDFTIACPAFPETGRTIYMGHLFVGESLLSDTHMRHHPLTPMTDSNLVRVLARQTPHKTGLVSCPTVAAGADAVRRRFAQLRREGVRHAVPDAVEDAHLETLGEACADLKLITGGSGIALGLPANFRRQGLLADATGADALPAVEGLEAVLAGSCSAATLGQIEEMARQRPAFRLDPTRLAEGGGAAEALAWARERLADGPPLIYASAPPEEVKAVQARLGREAAGELVERAMAEIARGLVEAGVRRLVVAGGETSGAVVQALGVKGLRIGPQIDPGVPATVSIGERPLALALKSGNFGARDFFLKAFEVMP